MSTKNTILKAYDGLFRDTFEKVLERNFLTDLKKKILYTNIDL